VTPDEDDRTRSEARGAELSSELAATDARRAEDETAKAHEEVEAAQKREQEAAEKEKQLEQRAEEAGKVAERERTEADQSAAPPNASRGWRAGVASVAAGGGPQSATDKPEVMIGAAFAGAFVFAQILKRLVD
jgi:hypothetical protein